CGGMERFTQGYKEFGLNVQPDNSVICHEWAPGADQLALIGDFSEFNCPHFMSAIGKVRDLDPSVSTTMIQSGAPQASIPAHVSRTRHLS
ncbi:hypothetical protein ANCDUO_19659, partial [Ancylostoma duodenale]